MNTGEFNSLTPAEVNQGFQLCYENSKDLFNSAELLAQNKKYGIANSLLILSVEESIKAINFLKKKKEPGKNIDVTGLFSDHKTKHKIAKRSTNSVCKFLKSYMNDFFKLIHSMNNINPEDLEKLELEHKKFNDKIEKIESQTENDWWSHAANLKNKGFYVNYNNNGFSCPNSINRDEYETTYSIVGQFQLFIKVIKDLW